VKDELQRIPDELFVYVNDYFGDDIGSAVFRGGGAVRGRKFPRNTRTGPGTLRIVSGDLLRATERDGKGNIYKLTNQGGTISIDYGVDTGIIPYAAIHEYGGNAGRGLKTRIPARPYLRPAFEAFEREEWPQVIRRIDNRIRSLF
jgi:hypothetical protein